MKFKVGDEVILVKRCFLSAKGKIVPVGSKGIVNYMTGFSHGIGVTWDCGKQDAFSEDKLEHALVFDSPLYLALK